MRRPLQVALFLLTAFALAGCAQPIVASDPLSQAGHPASTDQEAIGAVYSLPMTVVTIGSSVDAQGHQTYTITPSILPDNSARFRLRYIPTSLSDDSVTLSVDQNGLLSSVVANSTGRQGDIVVALATTAASVATLGGAGIPMLAPMMAAPGAPGSPPPPPPPAPKCSKTFTVVFDLDQLSEGQTLPDCSNAVIDWRRAAPLATDTTPVKCDYSVCYRALTTVTLMIMTDAQVKQAKFVAADPNLVEGVNLDSAPFVARTHNVTFSSGLLTSAVLNDPSVALAVANLPMTVIKALISAPGALTSVQVTNVQDQTSLLTAQAALINAQAALKSASTAAKTPVTGSGTTQ
jgi:hypothetical protein